MNEIHDPVLHDAIDDVTDPRAHDFFVGHEAAHSHMRSAIDSNRLPQAWLLTGPRGVGKATFAWHYARRLVKAADASIPPTADELAAYAGGRHFQIYDLAPPFDEKTGFKSQIPIETIRGLGNKLSTASDLAGYRAIIIDPADTMNNASANALLKMLEEPPKRVIFFLVSSNPDRLLPTIKSRCQQLRFAPLSATEIAQIWPKVTSRPLPNEAHLALADGSMRTALEIDDNFIQSYQRVVQVFTGHADYPTLFDMAARFASMGRNQGLAQAAMVIQIGFGRIMRRAIGEKADGSFVALAEIEAQAAAVVARSRDSFAQLSFEIQGTIHDAIALNLDAETVIFQALRAIDQRAKGQ